MPAPRMAETGAAGVMNSMPSLDEIRRHLKSRLLRRGASADEADDLIQEAFLRLEQYAAQHEVREPEGFLMRTVVNLAIDASRSRRRSPTDALTPEAMAAIPDGQPDPAEVFDAGRRLKKLSAGIGSLSPRTRRILLAQRLEGRSYAEIAREEGITVSAVEKHIAKAILKLTQWMNDE